jgi:glycine cleavage system regulatory protein
MDRTLILTAIGSDRPGLTSALAAAVHEAGGNWLESRLSRMAGKYVGSILVQVAGGDVKRLEAAIRKIDPVGLSVSIADAGQPIQASGQALRLSLVGQDHPGIVREVTTALADLGVNIESLETSVEPMAQFGVPLFRAQADLTAPPTLDAREVAAALERLSAEIMVDITLEERRS